MQVPPVDVTWTGEAWTSRLTLPSLQPLHEGDSVSVEFLMESPSAADPPGAIQLEAALRLIHEQDALPRIILDAIRGHYQRARPRYVAFAAQDRTFMGDPDVSMPADPDDGQLTRLHRLQAVYVHDVGPGHLAYVGFLFRAAWEPEHGVGVLVHGTRVVKVGAAETAFAERMAEEDRDDEK